MEDGGIGTEWTREGTGTDKTGGRTRTERTGYGTGEWDRDKEDGKWDRRVGLEVGPGVGPEQRGPRAGPE